MKRLKLFLALLVIGAGAGGWFYLKHQNQVEMDRVQSHLQQAEIMFQNNQPAEAAALLAPWRHQKPKNALDEMRMALDLKALEASGDSIQAQQVAKTYKNQFPNGSAWVDAECVLLHPQLEVNPSDAKARSVADELLQRYPEHAAVARLQVILARADVNQGKLDAAQQRLIPLMTQGLSSAEEGQVVELLGEINMALLLSDKAVSEEDKVIKLQKGQYVYNIARDHKIPMELLLKVNRINDPRRLRIGRTIRIPDISFSLLCDKSENTMTLYNHGDFFKRYTVRTGRRADATPVGGFKVLNKKLDPKWVSPVTNKKYAPGDPENELGTRWMAFQGDILGIHGTIHPETVGHYASNGCIGMLKEDVEELFDLIPVGTPLEIVGEQDTSKYRIIESSENNDMASAQTRY